MRGVCRVSVCVCVRARDLWLCVACARFFVFFCVIFIFMYMYRFFEMSRYIGAFTFFLVFSLFVCLRFCARAREGVWDERASCARLRAHGARSRKAHVYYVYCILLWPGRFNFQGARVSEKSDDICVRTVCGHV